MEPFKARMKRIRQRAGFNSQGDAAAAIGCPRGTVGMWEAPSSSVEAVSSDLLFSVARAYKVRPEWINDLASSDDGYPQERRLHTCEPDADILRAAIAWLRGQFQAWRFEFDAADRAAMIVEVYAVLASPGVQDLVGLSQRIGRLLEQERAE